MPDYPPRADLEVEDSWQVAQGTYEGHPVILRYRDGLAEIAGHPDFGHHVGIVIVFSQPGPNGYPGRDEMAALNAFEARLAALEEGNRALLVAVVTTNGMREFVFYTGSPAAIEGQSEALKAAAAGHDIQVLTKPDPEWQSFAFLMALISSPE